MFKNMKYDRSLLNFLKKPVSRNKVRLIFGARQTGKSTLFKILSDRQSELIDLQERSERTRFNRDPSLLTRRLSAIRKKHKHILIDEIQKAPGLLDEIQLIMDRFPGKFTFTLTGSSARKIKRGSANTLPGRSHLFHLSGITLWEQGEYTRGHILPPPGRLQNRFPRKSLENLLITGSLPGWWSEKEAFLPTLESYAELYLEEEIEREALVRGIGRFGNFLQLAALESGKHVNLTKISQESGIAVSTLQGFYPVLEDTLVGFQVPPFSRSEKIRIIKTPKFYFFDVGVRNAVARVPMDKKYLTADKGYLFEHWLACELYTRTRYLGRSYRLSFWRTVSGAEVDFILETPSEIIPIEAKFTHSPGHKDASHIETFIQHYPRARRGFVVCRIKKPEQLSRHVTAIPWNEI
jgi:predicted AAA+ superfamily ATPase